MNPTTRERTSDTAQNQGRSQPPLPRLRSGVRWTIRRSPHLFQVRAMRDSAQPEKLRVFDTVTRRPVLKVTNRPGSAKLPDNDVLFRLLTLADSQAPSTLTRELVGLCWLLTETADGFALQLRVRVPGAPSGHRVTPYPLPLASSGWAAALQTATAVLKLTPGYEATTTGDALTSLGTHINGQRLR